MYIDNNNDAGIGAFIPLRDEIHKDEALSTDVQADGSMKIDVHLETTNSMDITINNFPNDTTSTYHRQ